MLSLERIGRVESVWNALLQGADDEEAVRSISHDLHTLKGDAKVVGFDAVHALAQKLEELLALASHPAQEEVSGGERHRFGRLSPPGR
jgi:chemotaxis protein histidine kinase CheA